MESKPAHVSFALESLDFRLFLQSEFLRRCGKNRHYSLRAFARFLEMDVSTLSKILKGRRPVREQAIRRLGTRLGLDPREIARFEAASPRANASRSSSSQAHEYRQIALDSFQVIADWHHYAILELMRLPRFKGEASWIARTLHLPQSEAQLAIDRLVRLQMIEILPNGTWKDRSGGYSTTLGNDFSAAAFRKLQKQILEGALRSLEEVPMEKRSQTSITMAADHRRLSRARKLIVEFQRKLNRLMGPTDRRRLNSIYQLSISLYPLHLHPDEKRSP